jgi:phosphoribosylformylglycinamidine cyclo-ligase
MSVTYADSGVSIDAGNEAVRRMKQHIRSTFNDGVLADVGSFGGMFQPNFGGMREPVLVSSMDGVGTKLKVAFMTGKHDTVGRDLVWHCVNDILVQGARPLFFLDYFATGKLDPIVAADVVKGLAEGCRTSGCVLIGGETAEMPGMYQEGEYDIAGCIVGMVDKSKIITGASVAPGDVLIGLASEGLHTNGYSLARKVLFEVGNVSVEEVADELLAPHRCYAPAILPILDAGDTIKAMAHITGGGFYDNIPRSLPESCGAVVQKSSFTVLPIFERIQSIGNVPEADMYRTFNMGIGLVLVVAPEHANATLATLRASGETASIIGEVTAGVHEVVLA